MVLWSAREGYIRLRALSSQRNWKGNELYLYIIHSFIYLETNITLAFYMSETDKVRFLKKTVYF